MLFDVIFIFLYFFEYCLFCAKLVHRRHPICTPWDWPWKKIDNLHRVAARSIIFYEPLAYTSHPSPLFSGSCMRRIKKNIILFTDNNIVNLHRSLSQQINSSLLLVLVLLPKQYSSFDSIVLRATRASAAVVLLFRLSQKVFASACTLVYRGS